MCPNCGGYTNGAGHCYTCGCANSWSLFVPEPRKPLRPQSDKKREEVRVTRKARTPAPGEQCELCRSPAVETHEIAAGAHRQRAVHIRAAQLRVCRWHHDMLQGMDYAMQLAWMLKIKVVAINECHGSNAVTVSDVIGALQWKD